MTLTKHATLVENAIRRRSHTVMAKAMDSRDLLVDSTRDGTNLEPYAYALSLINDHITVPQEVIDSAASAYQEIAHRLVNRLDWPAEAIEIHPQGSACTRTLIRSARRTKFDIDAVCSVDITRIEAHDPMSFFAAIGRALDGLEVTRKKRCWSINFPNEPFYLEFTPSVPIETVPAMALDRARRRLLAPEYRHTALAVVDTPTEGWKTSNPAGLGKWVDDVSKRKLVAVLLLEKATRTITADVAPVPKQSINIVDTLRIAIRLFKRHRDMCVYRNYVEEEFQPISIILVTLLTICYDGLADLGRVYSNPVRLLVDLAGLLPHMIEKLPDLGYYVGNPTVEGENFAERWNTDSGKRAEAFGTWCGLLQADLRKILAASERREIENRAREVFGCRADAAPTGSGGPTPTTVTRRPPPAAPRTSGLA
ncbi:nucleotidyltransferase [Burkholderia cepacia]|uniref:nucleotidyltransferase domain-containing protein n=1 Tax=Burkholderia cepacia TaxID=292 RepID=UPI0011AC1E6F|nr:nucleotidyltransferase [Burkholderia cepacia]MDN7894376.1 nucleotidyltransferase [Burkholderia cepacia]